MTIPWERLCNGSVLIFVIVCMAAAGLGLTFRELIAPLSRVRFVLASLGTNFLIAPAIAYGLTKVFALPAPFETGLLLLGGAAGAPFLPKLTDAAKADPAFSVGLMLLLMVGSVAYMPVALPVLIPGLAAEPWPILKPLLITMLLPLALGMFVRSRAEQFSSRLRRMMVIVSNVSMLLALGLLIALNFQALLGTFGTGAAAVGTLFVTLAVLAGAALGGPKRDTRAVLALGTGQRNVAAALLVATQNFDDPAVVIMLLVTTLAGLVPLLLAVRYFAKTSSPRSGVSDGQA